MSFDELQLSWQHERNAAATPPIDAALLRRVRSDSRKFSRGIFWRDVREVVASILVAFIFGKIAWEAHQEGSASWPAWVAAVLPLGVAAFFMFDRWLSHRREDPRGDHLLAEIDRAQQAVGHQIHLLKNVFWWYLLPLMISVGFLVLQVVLYMPTALPPLVAGLIKVIIGLVAMVPMGWFNWWVWQQNQKAVREELQPQWNELAARRRELLADGDI